MACSFAKPTASTEREPGVDLGRWRVTLADLEALSRRFRNPRPVNIRLARRVVDGVTELLFYDTPLDPWPLFNAAERRALHARRRP
jgi:hypothetical protein